MKNSPSAREARNWAAVLNVVPAVRRRVRAILGAMALLSVTVPWAGPWAAAAPTLSGEAYAPVLWGPAQVSTDYVEYAVDVTSTGSSSDYRYLNVVRDDGTWVVWNLAVGLEPGTRRMATQVDASLFQNGASYQTTIDTTIRTTAPTYAGGTFQTLGAPVSYQEDNGWGVTEFGPLGRPPTPPHEPPPFVFPDPFPWVWHPNMPDTPQGANQCGPASAANSLSWLDQKHHWGLPTPDLIRQQLVIDMETHWLTGTTLDQFLKGKDKYVNSPIHKLPIVTHQISTSLASIEAEMKKEQDVELFIKNLVDGGGHVVTLVGIRTFGPEHGAQIAFVDPGDRKNQIQEAWVSSTGIIDTGVYALYEIRYAVAESVVPEPSTLTLFGIGAAALLAYGRRRRFCNELAPGATRRR